MAINTIEQAIITTLQTAFTTVEHEGEDDEVTTETLKVEGFPDKPSEYKLLHPTGAILVAYNGSDYSVPESLQYVEQIHNMEFGATLIVRNLRDKNGAYNHIDKIISTLTGYSPTGCWKIYPKNVRFLVENSGIWQYAITFNVTNENIEGV
jgi:hypothetical protein